jgi:hypothetical protein
MRRIRIRRRYAAFAAILLAVAAGGGIAYATIPDSNGVIHGCYAARSGALRIIDDAAQTCGKSETAIDWNRTGPQGSPGLRGQQGAPGISGYTLLFAQPAMDTSNAKDVYAWCPLGKKILGGGVALNQPVSGIAIYRTQPVHNAVVDDGTVRDVWWGSAEEIVTTSSDWQLNAYAICADVAS